MVSTKKNAGAPGKSGRNVKFVDTRLKKDSRALNKRIKKARQTKHVHRKNKKRARFWSYLFKVSYFYLYYIIFDDASDPNNFYVIRLIIKVV